MPDESTGDGQGQDSQEQPPAAKLVNLTQAQLNNLIDAKYTEAFKKAEGQFAPKIAALTAEIETLKAARPAPDDDADAGGKGKDKAAAEKARLEELLKPMEAKLAEMERARAAEVEEKQKLLGRIKLEKLIAASAQAGAVDGELLASIIRDQVEVDAEGRVRVTDANGLVRVDPDTGEPLAVEKLAAQVLEERPYLKRAEGRGGAGTGLSGITAPEGTRQATGITIEQVEADFSRYTKASPEVKAAYRKKHSGTQKVIGA